MSPTDTFCSFMYVFLTNPKKKSSILEAFNMTMRNQTIIDTWYVLNWSLVLCTISLWVPQKNSSLTSLLSKIFLGYSKCLREKKIEWETLNPYVLNPSLVLFSCTRLVINSTYKNELSNNYVFVKKVIQIFLMILSLW